MAKHVLIVEDDDSIRETTSELLSMEGFDVVAVKNGREALQYLKRTPREPCLVLTDLFMPEMDGLELLKMMKESDKLMSLPVLVLTAGAYRKPPNGLPYLKKPFGLDELLRHVINFCGDPNDPNC